MNSTLSMPRHRAGPVPASRRAGLQSVALVMVALLGMGAVWALLGPPALGGRTSYVVTRGTSMLPHFRAGDLVALRPEREYHVGEVAAYHNGSLGIVVMHRIIAKDGARFVFQGDNNSFRDTFEPTASEIVGAEWMHLGGVGRYVETVRSPRVAAVLLALVWLLSFGPARPKGGNADDSAAAESVR